MLYKFANLLWYDAIHTTIVSRGSSAMSRSLITDSVFNCSGVSVRSLGIPVSVERYTGFPAGCCSVGRKYPGEFIHPLAFS